MNARSDTSARDFWSAGVKGGNMNIWRGVTIAMMVTGTMLASGTLGEAAQETTPDKAPKVEDKAAGKPVGKASKDGRVTQKRRSSGKSTGEDTTNAQSPKPSDSREGTPGTTLMFRSDGKGNSGETTQ